MSQLSRIADRKVFLILDNLKVHHSLLVKDWLEENMEKFEAFNLPSYEPELNPDEYPNGDLKHHIRSGLSAGLEKDSTKKTRSFMGSCKTDRSMCAIISIAPASPMRLDLTVWSPEQQEQPE